MGWKDVSEKKKANIKKDVEKLAVVIKAKEKVRVGLKTKFIFYIMRMMQNKNWGSSPEEKEYWQEKGWLNKNRPWK